MCGFLVPERKAPRSQALPGNGVPCARSGKSVKQGRKRLRKATKGYRAGRHHLHRQAVVTLLRAGVFAYRDRKVKKRSFRELWIIRINAACRARGIRYSQFIRGLAQADVVLNRKMLSEIAIHDPASFDQLVTLAKANLPKGLTGGIKK
jgi:large subunit ribosomal protein L20